jgi:hypothetical protein
MKNYQRCGIGFTKHLPVNEDLDDQATLDNMFIAA